MSNFILTLNLKTEKYQEDILDKRLEIARNIYNGCLGELFRRYRTLKQSKRYQKVLKMNKGTERNKLFNELNKKYNLTEYSLHTYVKPMQKHFKTNIDSHSAQKIATRCFDAFKKLMFHTSNKAYFKKYGELMSVESKTNNSGIRFKDNKLMWNKLEISVVVKKNDTYAQMSLENKIKYCRIIKRFVNGKYKYYIQLILDGIPPKKYTQIGEIKNSIRSGNVGLDIGTQTIAISSDTHVKLLELAPEVNNIEKQKRILLRKMDRSRRTMNINNFNKDGTIKKGIKLKWIKSNKYIKIQEKLKEKQRKQADIRKLSHYKLVNYILSLGNTFFVEKMNFKALQRRAKKTTINEKTGKYNKKKRFGKSLANKSPSMLLTMLDNKLKWLDKSLNKINTHKCKASQYNHFIDEYNKKELKDRWDKETNIQRDLYSAFLIQNVEEDLNSINRKKCLKYFDRFKILHDIEILRLKELKSNGHKLISSMGI